MKSLLAFLRSIPSNETGSDSALLNRFLDGTDEGAFAELVRRHGPLVWSVCRAGLRNVSDAEDAFQTVFMVLLRRSQRLRDRETIGPWLYRVTVWTVRNLSRKNHRQQLRRVELFETLSPPIPQRSFDIDDALADLPEKYRTPIVLCLMQGWSRSEAAEMLGCPEGTLSSLLHRGLEKLRTRMANKAAPALVFSGLTLPPATLMAATVQMAIRFPEVVGISPIILTTTNGVLRMFPTMKWLACGILAFAGTTIGLGFGLVPSSEPQAIAQDPPKLPPVKVPPAQPPIPVPVAGVEAAPKPAAKPKLLATFAENKAQAWSVAFSPDGKTVASGAGGTLGNPGELKLWDAKTHKELFLVETERSVRWVAFSPDGKTIATAEHDNIAYLRDATTGKTIRAFKGHTSGIDTVAFSPDGKTLITSSWDKTAKLWNVATGEEIRTLDGHAEQVYTVAFSPKGKRVASGCNDGTIKIWDVATGKETATLSGHKGVVHSVAFGAKDKLIASVGWDKTVRLWNAKKGTEVAVLEGHTVPVLGVAFSADGTMLASVSGRWGDGNYAPGPGEIILWDVKTRKEIARITGHDDRIFAVNFSPDGKTLATASWDKTIKLWDIAALKTAK